MNANGNTNWFRKPNRRLNTQRRVNRLDRRQGNLVSSFCRRSTTLSRRTDDRRTSLHSTEWIQLSNTRPRKKIYVCANDTPRIGQFIDLAV